MDNEILQTLRYKLQKRLKRINTAGAETYQSILSQSWGFLESNPAVKGIFEDLERRVPSAEQTSLQIKAGEAHTGDDELGHVAICYWIIKSVLAAESTKAAISISRQYARGIAKSDEALEYFTENFVEPLFDYVDEQLDDHRMTLSLLRKYKHRTEWFYRDQLRSVFEAEPRFGEKKLALDLYAFLFDQGLDFTVEPSSISGKADLISAQTGSDRLVADVKIFDPTRSKGLAYLHSGFNQVYQYTKDFNDPFGFLVIYKTCGHDLSVNAREQDTSFPSFTHNNKTIFVIVIDIFDYPESASKRGSLQSYELLEQDLIRMIEETPLMNINEPTQTHE